LALAIHAFMGLRRISDEFWNCDEGKPLIEGVETGDYFKVGYKLKQINGNSAAHSADEKQIFLSIFEKSEKLRYSGYLRP
jgi:hypothetical protein